MRRCKSPFGTRLLFGLMFFAASVIPLVSASAPANFSGTWKADTGKSDFGRVPAPNTLTDTISQDGSAITIQRDRDGQPNTLRIPLDGSTVENTLRGVSMKTSARWQDATLVVTAQGRYFGSSVGYEEHWSLSADRKLLTIQRHLNGPQGETDQTVVMVKQ